MGKQRMSRKKVAPVNAGKKAEALSKVEEKRKKFLQKLKANASIQKKKPARKSVGGKDTMEEEPTTQGLSTFGATSGLSTALEELFQEHERKVAAKKATQALPTQVKTLKARQRIAAAEIAQFQAVQQHPAFVAEPFSTITEHLRNVIQKQQHEAAQRATATATAAAASSTAATGTVDSGKVRESKHRREHARRDRAVAASLMMEQ